MYLFVSNRLYHLFELVIPPTQDILEITTVPMTLWCTQGCWPLIPTIKVLWTCDCWRQSRESLIRFSDRTSFLKFCKMVTKPTLFKQLWEDRIFLWLVVNIPSFDLVAAIFVFQQHCLERRTIFLSVYQKPAKKFYYMYIQSYLSKIAFLD